MIVGGVLNTEACGTTGTLTDTPKQELFTSRVLCATIIKYDTCHCTESCNSPICFPF